MAQSVVQPSLLTPQTFRPATVPDGFVIATPRTRDQSEVQGGHLSVMLGTVTVEGGRAALRSEEDKVIADLGQRRISIKEIHAKVDDLERAYARAGFVLVRVLLPPQKLVNGGPLKIAVVDGYLEDIDVSGVPERVRPVVAARVADLVGKKGLLLSELERAVLIAGATAGLDLKSTLARGDKDGGTKLVLEGTHTLLRGSTSSDNRISKSLGSVQHFLSASLNSPIGAGEQFYATGGMGNDPRDQFRGKGALGMFAGGLVLPLGVTGLTVNPEFTLSKTYPVPTTGAPQSKGSFQRFAVRGEYPAIQTHALLLKSRAAIEFVRQTQDLPDFGVQLSRDDYAVARGGFDVFGQSLFDIPTFGSVTLSHGLRGRNTAPGTTAPSRQQADPDFTKLGGSVKLSQPVAENLRVTVAASGQYAFNQAMFSSEQFALDGTEAVSGYPSGSFAVDQGVTLRTEIIRSFSLDMGESTWVLAPYVFAATGTGRLTAPTAVERRTQTAVSAGAGMRVNLPSNLPVPGLSATTELARAHSDHPTLHDVWRMVVSLGLVF